MWPFPPSGYTLRNANGQIRNRIRGDLIPRGTLVVVYDGKHFVRTGHKDDAGFLVYTEGFSSFEYQSDGA